MTATSDIVDNFPEDPNLPSLTYQASENVPICIPWSHNPITLGAGFKSSVATTDKNPFCRSAFSYRSLTNTPLQYVRDVGIGNFTQTSTSHATSSYEHIDLKIGASVGGSFLGASVSGQYAKSVLANKNANKISVRSTTRHGIIIFSSLPALSALAFSCLQNSGVDAFRAEYGDYYLAGLRLGADNATLLSSSASLDSKSEAVEVEVKAKVLWFTKTLYRHRSASSESEDKYSVTLTSFDTLNNTHHDLTASKPSSFVQVAEDNIEGGRNLEKRVLQRMEQAKLTPNATLTLDQCQTICTSGLVAELLFMPYGGLREVIVARAAS